jgi:hypothetical protein
MVVELRRHVAEHQAANVIGFQLTELCQKKSPPREAMGQFWACTNGQVISAAGSR